MHNLRYGIVGGGFVAAFHMRAFCQVRGIEVTGIVTGAPVDKLIAFAKHWGFRPRACAPYRGRTKGKTESGVGYVKKNAIAGHSIATWEAFEAHLARWERDIANVRIHGTTGEVPMVMLLQTLPTFRPSRKMSTWRGSSAA